MAKLKKRAGTSDQEANGNGDGNSDHTEKEQNEGSWLDDLTASQADRDQLYRNAESGDFSTPKQDFTKLHEQEPASGKPPSNPIPAKTLADAIVDSVFEFIQENGHTPNWPRVMTAFSYAERQLRRRWREIYGRDKDRFAQRFDELKNKRTAEQKEAEAKANDAASPASPEYRGGEALVKEIDEAQGTSLSQMAEPTPGLAVPVEGEV